MAKKEQMPETKIAKSQITRAMILEKALALFRKRGFEGTTMRDIAHAAGLATGAAYYYFPSKESIVMAYYDRVQDEHEKRVRDALVDTTDLHERLCIVMYTKLDILSEDRRILGALFRFTGDPENPLSILGKGTEAQRSHSLSIFREAIGNETVPEDLRSVLPTFLWVLHLGIILFFVYDNSPEQRRTRQLTDGVLDLLVQFLSLSSVPVLRTFMQPVRAKAVNLLREAGLVPQS